MRPLKQIMKQLCLLCQYLFCYIFLSSAIIAIFALIYWGYGYNNAWKISFEIFWQIENYTFSNVLIIIYLERIAKELFVIILVGTVLARFLRPLNPILFSNYVTYDTVSRKMVFRYWIMLGKNQYLYDTKIKLLLADYESHQEGKNNLKCYWKIDENENRLNYDLARGIRYVELTEKESSALMKAIEKLQEKHLNENGNYIGGEWSLDLSVRGTDEKGTIYHGWHKYKLDDILLGYRPVPLQRHCYDTEDFYSEIRLSATEKNKLYPSKDFYSSGKKEFFRYQHFDKVYQLKSSAYATKAYKNHDILSKDQIIHGQYGKIRQFCLDLLSSIVWFFLDSDKSLKQIKKNILNIDRILHM